MKRLSIYLAMRFKKEHLIAISIGVVYFLFGILKFFAGLSPAEDLAKQTMSLITFGLIPDNISILLLASWETVVGLMLIFNLFKRAAIILAFTHIIFTFTPLFLFPELTFLQSPFQPTILGQYIAKNIIIVAALITMYQEMRTNPA